MTLPLIFSISNGMVMANQSTSFLRLEFLCIFKRRCTGACNCPNINPIKSIRLEAYQMSTIKKRIPMFLLALAMMVAMALPTFAAEPRALLDVPTNTKVHITSCAYSSAYLNVENTAPIVKSGDTVGVWSNTGDDSQRWYIEAIDAGNRLYRVGCYNHTDLTLNIYSPSDANAACTVYPWRDNDSSDYTIKIVDESGNPLVSNVFGFVLPPYLKCMSASGGTKGSNVYWRSSDSSQSQLWDITRG